MLVNKNHLIAVQRGVKNNSLFSVQIYRNLNLKALLHVRIFMKNIPFFYYSSNILQGFTHKNID